jgi:hypothetical protein
LVIKLWSKHMNVSFFYRSLFVLIIVIFFVSLKAQAQPYYYYETYPLDTNGYTQIAMINFASGAKETFLQESYPSSSGLHWDDTQSWIYYWTGNNPNEGPVTLISTNQSSLHQELPDSGVEYSLGVKYVPQLNRIYVSSNSENYAFDATSLAKVDSFDIVPLTIWGNEFLSESGDTLYFIDTDSVTEKTSIAGYSLRNKKMVSRKLIDQIGPPTNTKVLFDGKIGKALLGYNYPSAESKDGQYILYDASKDIFYDPIIFPIISTDLHLSADAKYVIIHETPPNLDHNPETPSHILLGKISVFESTTGKLISRLSLTTGGKVMIFDNYPNMLYYYLPSEQRSINIDLSKLSTITSLSPAITYAGSSAFTLTVNGKNFVNGSTVNWTRQTNGGQDVSAKTTTYISDSVLQASITASDVASIDSPLVAVKSPDGMAESNSIRFYVLKRQSVPELIEELRVKLQQCFTANQIGDRRFVQELDDHLKDAKRDYLKRDSIGCAQELEAFQQSTRKEYNAKPKKHDKRFVEEEAYKLLYFGAQNIVELVIILPPRSTGSVPNQINALKIQVRTDAEDEIIGGEILVRELVSILDRARQQLQRKDDDGAALHMLLFQQAVRRTYEITKKVPRSKLFVRAEGYISLYYRAGYILEQLSGTNESRDSLPKLEPELEKELNGYEKEVVE